MNIEINKEIPHADYCGFQYAEENISSSSEEQFEDSNEQSEPNNSGFLGWSDSDISLALSITALRSNPYSLNETTNYTEKSSESRPCVRCERGGNSINCDRYDDYRERELLHKMLTRKSEMETQTESPQKEKHEKFTFMRVTMVVLMIVLSFFIIKDYSDSTVMSIINYCSKCCLCVFLSSTVNYITSFVKH